MNRFLTLTPSGHFVYADAAGDRQEANDAGLENLQQAPDAETEAVRLAFERSVGEGLEILASSRFHRKALPAELAWLRELSRSFFTALCNRPASGAGSGSASQGSGIGSTSQGPDTVREGNPPPAAPPIFIPGPDAAFIASWIEAAPPMQGSEYLDTTAARAAWEALAARATAAITTTPDGLGGYLRALNPDWHAVGRVTFHLAENKRNPEFPFAFLATYAHGLSATGTPQHLPLGRALQEYAGAGRRDALARLLEPVRLASEVSPLARELLESRRVFQPQLWTPAQAYRFLVEIPKLKESGVTVRIPDWWKTGRPPRPQVKVRVGDNASAGLGLGALVDFKIDIALEGESLTEAELRTLLGSAGGLVLLKGRWVEVDKDRLGAVLDHWKALERKNGSGGLTLLEGLRLLSGFEPGRMEMDETAPETEREHAWAQVTAGTWLSETLASLQGGAAGAASDPGPALRATLRPYQRAGVQWLWSMHRLGVGACLADDMGLGKTIQIIALLLALRRDGSDDAAKPEAEAAESARGASAAPAAKGTSEGKTPTVAPSLLVVPASLLANWKNELARFAPDLRSRFLHPSETPSEEIAAVAADPAGGLAGTDLVLVTYGMVLRQEWLQTMGWRLIVLDEAQAIKNPGAKQTKAVKALKAGHRLALTGTPIENRLSDLWSLYDFLNPGLLGGASEFAAFVKRQENAGGDRRFAALRRLVRPLLLRRLKTDRSIISDLPEKTEIDAFCPLSPVQAALYQEAVQNLQEKLASPEVEGIQRRGLVLAFLTRLKQICNHPSQWLGDDAWQPADSGKFGRLQEIAEEIAARQEKMLVFTQYRTMAAPLARFLEDVFGRPGLVLDGSTPVAERQRLVERFQKEEGPPCFVLSLKAGGTGLNLTAAAHVVHFDRWWNPAVENQATDRAFRIGQKKNVMVHKFVCRGTLEERIHDLIAGKRGLAEDILGGGLERMLTEMGNAELLRFVSLDVRAADAD